MQEFLHCRRGEMSCTTTQSSEQPRPTSLLVGRTPGIDCLCMGFNYHKSMVSRSQTTVANGHAKLFYKNKKRKSIFSPKSVYPSLNIRP